MDWHPFIVHYPIAFLTVSPLCDLLALILRRRALHHLAYGMMVLGALAACAAVLSGNASADGHWEGSAAAEVSAHEGLATWTLLLALGTALGRLPLHLRGQFRGWLFYVWIGTGVAVGILAILTGYFGGELVYVHGVGVGG